MPGSESSPSDLLLSDYARELLRKVTEAGREAGAGARDDFDKGRHMGPYEALDFLRHLLRDFEVTLEGVSLGEAGSIEELSPLK